MKNIIITGANSFIGSYFKSHSKENKISEICLIENKPSDIDFNNTDVVFHVAALVHQKKSIPESTYFKINSDLAYEVAKTAKHYGVKQFVFMSTVKVYGENSTNKKPWTEKSKCFPVDGYGKSKLNAEKRLMKLNDETFKVSIIRTPVVYGEGVKGNIFRIAKFVEKWKFIPFKGINNKRAMVYIGNLIALINKVIEKQQSGIFLASDNKIISTSEFVKHLINSSCKKKYFIIFPIIFQKLIKLLKPNLYNRLFNSMVVDNSKTFKELSFVPPYSIEFGLDEVMKSLK